MRLVSNHGFSWTHMGSAFVRVVAPILPTVILSLGTLRADTSLLHWLGVGAAIQLVILCSLMTYHRSFSPPIDSNLLFGYVLGIGWLWFAAFQFGADWFLHLSQAVMVLVPLGMVAAYALMQSGALEARRADKLARKLQCRRDWPRLAECHNLAEVKALREALQLDATPALELLGDPMPEIRVAALAALEFRKAWRPGQAETVLTLLQREKVPEVRAAAVNALANVDDRMIIEAVSVFLRDAEPLVRHATANALLWNTDGRWSWIRFGVRRALCEPSLRDDGSLIETGHKLPPEALDNLMAWSAEKGIIGMRSVQTLMVHYSRSFEETPEETVNTLLRLVHNIQTPSLLRIEAARFLGEHMALETPALEGLLDAANPAPLRLIAAEALLHARFHTGAVEALKEIARLPNRDLALFTADIVQRRLGVDLGLGLHQPLPPLDSSKAVEITRRLMNWARQPVEANVFDTPGTHDTKRVLIPPTRQLAQH